MKARFTRDVNFLIVSENKTPVEVVCLNIRVG